jgi:hypothetical protein
LLPQRHARFGNAVAKQRDSPTHEGLGLTAASTGILRIKELYAEAVARGFEEVADRMVAAAEGAPAGRELHAMIERYLSVGT